MGTLVKLQDKAPEWALARLNRVTGLAFSRMPQSLLAPPEETAATQKPRLIAARFKSA